ncbi:MAG TPA: DUF721 domain-containing protein [Tenuifilaceae bacterium]|nr:DUF721 domain-containing protein [Tenuifilaceae bacterium]HRX32025.1 DUF721 domain-containing protein [Tenuifilaceae bacterium]
MKDHNITTLGEAIKAFVEKMKLSEPMNEASLKNDWHKITSPQIAKNTDDLRLKNSVLYIKTNSAALRQELLMQKQLLVSKINQFYNTELVKEIRLV